MYILLTGLFGSFFSFFLILSRLLYRLAAWKRCFHLNNAELACYKISLLLFGLPLIQRQISFSRECE